QVGVVGLQRPRLAPAVIVVVRTDQRRGSVRATGFDGFEDIVDAYPEVLREFLWCRRSVVLARQEVDRVPEIDVKILDAPGHLHRPRCVAEVATKLTHDGRDRVAGERHPD